MTTTVEFMFDLGQTVRLNNSNATSDKVVVGKVIGFALGRTGTKWATLQYVDKFGKVHEEFFAEDELNAVG